MKIKRNKEYETIQVNDKQAKRYKEKETIQIQ